MLAPPTGIVTFLFTDIQGSTQLWESAPNAMRPALARHDHLMRQAIVAHNGYVFKTVGDAFCAAFPTASEALAAALAAQVALAAEPWGLPTPLRVRMGLHTGSAEERDGDYFGPSLNRVARLMAAGHGGQTLLSGATKELTCDCLPEAMTLLDLGERRLKDLGRPEHVFQAVHPSLAADFPPLKSLDNPDLPNNLPQQVTSFIGREKQVEEVTSLLGRTRLLTLTGAGGCGKTRLSLQVAADLLDQYFDGVWLVELAALSDTGLIPQAAADVLGLREEPGKPIQRTLVESLKAKRCLMILDNCEHLVVACAALAADLLRNCPNVHVLTTSREPLNVAGEQTYRVPSLSSPVSRTSQSVESLSQYEAVRLFLERAQAVQPTFALTDANAPAVAQVCFHLDGIPLAIELAAARVRSLSAEEINRRLNQRFRLLTGRSRDTLPRQQTLRALIDWSYDLLTGAEKALLCRLSVFVGGWTLSAAEAVCSGEPVEDWEVLDLLTALVDKSLAAAEPWGDGTRYRLLETVRQYGGDRLEESGEAEAVSGRAAAYFLALAEEAEPQMRGPEQEAWLSRLETEHDNLRASLAWAEGRGDGGEDGLRLAGAMWRFWGIRGHSTEGRQWLRRALARTKWGAVEQEERAGEWAGAAARAVALTGAGNLARSQGDYVRAQALQEESLALKRQLGDRQGIANTLGNLGNVAENQGDYVRARALQEEALTLKRQLGAQQGIATTLNNLGNVAEKQGDYAEAQALYEETLTLNRQLGDRQGSANTLGNLGNVAQGQGDYVRAQTLQKDSLTLNWQLGAQQGIANTLNNLGAVAHRQSQMERSARLSGAAACLRENIGCPLSPLDQEEVDAAVASVAEALGEAAFATAWDAGRAMTLDEAVEYALSE